MTKLKFYHNPKSMERHEQLAEAYYKVASANHYMVGISTKVTDQELSNAKQVLIDIDNAHSTRTTRLALNLIEDELVIRRLNQTYYYNDSWFKTVSNIARMSSSITGRTRRP